jgi:hypothetical protein
MQLGLGLFQKLQQITGFGVVPAGSESAASFFTLFRAFTDSRNTDVTARRKRLFACAYCRLSGARLDTEGSREALRLSELLADNRATPEEVQPAFEEVRAAARSTEGTGAIPVVPGMGPTFPVVPGISQAIACPEAVRPVLFAVDPDIWTFLPLFLGAVNRPDFAQEAWSNLYHDLFDGLLHPASAPPAWLEWDCGTVARMAGTIYEERQFDDLPILADALEEAGCDNAGLLEHLRSGGPHYLGCWALDALLGKE